MNVMQIGQRDIGHYKSEVLCCIADTVTEAPYLPRVAQSLQCEFNSKLRHKRLEKHVNTMI